MAIRDHAEFMTFTPTGIFVPLITPFTDDGSIADNDLTRLAHRVLDAGATGIVALGTTAEASTLTPEEHHRVVSICGKICAEYDAPLIVGAGSNDTRASVSAFESLSGTADIAAFLTVVPYYSRPSEEGVLAHFRYLADNGPTPLVLYNVPYRTGQSLGPQAILTLAAHPDIVGIKQSVGAVDTDTAHLIAQAPQGFSVLAGEDTLVSPLLAMGARGAILATANVYPQEFAELFTSWRTGDVETARILGNRMVEPARALMSTPNPTGIKAALCAAGLIESPEVRLPLITVRESVA